MNPRNFFAELKRRKVYRVAITYAVVSWLLIQIATQVFPFFDIPNWTVRLVIILLALGFPVALILAWAFDLTAQGIKRTDDLAVPGANAGSIALPHPAASVDATVPEKSIAVLPFENLSDDKQNAYLADGIQDDILSSLAKVADLKVISRTSVRQYGTGTRNLREIGDALGVAHILEGTVRRSGDRVRVNAQLINARTDSHVWGETFDRELTDLFELQSDLAERITTALRANLSPREKASLQIHPTNDLEAYNLFLQARDLFRWSGAGDPRENGEKALQVLATAVARDPQFALAYSLTSRFHAELYWFGHDKSVARRAQAKAAAETALRLRPDLGDAHLALAFYHYYGFRDYDKARAEVEMAVKATPNDAEVWDGAAAIDRRQGRWNEAISNFAKAEQLDPRNPSVIWNLAETYACVGRYAEAEAGFANGLAVHPHAHLFAIARASIPLKSSGDVAPLRAALRNVPADFDPGGAVTTIGLRVSLMERDYDEAARLLNTTACQRYNDAGVGGTAAALDGYTFPRAWYEGLIARGQGQPDVSRKAFEAAHSFVTGDLRQSPDDAKTVAMLGLIDAALGRRGDAIRHGRRAVELLPISRDAYDGPMLATNLAVIYAQSGESDLALSELTRLMSLPGGPTAGTLRAEPEWDALREDARFQELVSRRFS
jgi:TolB-like protein/Flp pilus assembly protein TadD